MNAWKCQEFAGQEEFAAMILEVTTASAREATDVEWEMLASVSSLNIIVTLPKMEYGSPGVYYVLITETHIISSRRYIDVTWRNPAQFFLSIYRSYSK